MKKNIVMTGVAIGLVIMGIWITVSELMKLAKVAETMLASECVHNHGNGVYSMSNPHCPSDNGVRLSLFISTYPNDEIVTTAIYPNGNKLFIVTKKKRHEPKSASK